MKTETILWRESWDGVQARHAHAALRSAAFDVNRTLDYYRILPFKP
jgi:hypothetical protein